MTTAKVQTSDRYKATSVVLAFLIWGGWAYFVNSGQSKPGSASPITSGLIQGVGSSLITLVMLKSVTYLYRKLESHPFKLILPAVITSAVTVSCMTAAHTLAGTANLLATIAPGMIVAFCFNLVTTRELSRLEQDSANQGEPET